VEKPQRLSVAHRTTALYSIERIQRIAYTAVLGVDIVSKAKEGHKPYPQSRVVSAAYLLCQGFRETPMMHIHPNPVNLSQADSLSQAFPFSPTVTHWPRESPQITVLQYDCLPPYTLPE
jgi:hypothetical protein